MVATVVQVEVVVSGGAGHTPALAPAGGGAVASLHATVAQFLLANRTV